MNLISSTSLVFPLGHGFLHYPWCSSDDGAVRFTPIFILTEREKERAVQRRFSPFIPSASQLLICLHCKPVHHSLSPPSLPDPVLPASQTHCILGRSPAGALIQTTSLCNQEWVQFIVHQFKRSVSERLTKVCSFPLLRNHSVMLMGHFCWNERLKPLSVSLLLTHDHVTVVETEMFGVRRSTEIRASGCYCTRYSRGFILPSIVTYIFSPWVEVSCERTWACVQF